MEQFAMLQKSEKGEKFFRSFGPSHLQSARLLYTSHASSQMFYFLHLPYGWEQSYPRRCLNHPLSAYLRLSALFIP